MFRRLLPIAIMIAAGYWYWSGPYQEQRHPADEKKLENAIEDMRQCIRGMNYKSGATGENVGDPEAICAERHHLYLYEGEWRSTGE